MLGSSEVDLMVKRRGDSLILGMRRAVVEAVGPMWRELSSHRMYGECGDCGSRVDDYWDKIVCRGRGRLSDVLWDYLMTTSGTSRRSTLNNY